MPEPILSPDGRYALRFTCDEMRMSHWVFCPILVDCLEDRVLFSLAGTHWSTDVATWSDDSQLLVMGLRRYPGDTPGICVRIDVPQRLACLDDSAYSLPLAQLFERLEARYRSTIQSRGFHGTQR